MKSSITKEVDLYGLNGSACGITPLLLANSLSWTKGTGCAKKTDEREISPVDVANAGLPRNKHRTVDK
jgi:hypothetical protein